jgi:hypothetical protein
MFLIFRDFKFSCHTPGATVCISHFLRFSQFLAIFLVLECVSHFAHFSVFLAIFQVIKWVCPIFHVFQ